MKITISRYELVKKFPDAESARLYLEQRRWGGTPACPHCGLIERIQVRKVAGFYRCLSCKEDFTVRTGTIMERSHIPLDKWLHAMYLVATARKGISSMQLSKELGITQKSAWFLLSRIREACGNGRGGGGMLSGIVEADEVYMGGKDKNRHRSKAEHFTGGKGKTVVFGMRERDGKTRAVVVGRDMGFARLDDELHANVKAGSMLCTDEASMYKSVRGFHRFAINHSRKEYVDGIVSTNSIESVWALLKRGYYGVYHHFSVKHMQRYVDEFTYRLNEGNCKVHTMDRIDALVAKANGVRITYKALTADA
jgi:transposase-like protein